MSGPARWTSPGPAHCNAYTYLWTWDTYADATVPVHSILKDGGRKNGFSSLRILPLVRR